MRKVAVILLSLGAIASLALGLVSLRWPRPAPAPPLPAGTVIISPSFVSLIRQPTTVWRIGDGVFAIMRESSSEQAGPVGTWEYLGFAVRRSSVPANWKMEQFENDPLDSLVGATTGNLGLDKLNLNVFPNPPSPPKYVPVLFRQADSVELSFWTLTIALGACPLLVLLRHPAHRRRFRIEAGLCVRCAYNLRGNASGVCPECGTEVMRMKRGNGESLLADGPERIAAAERQRLEAEVRGRFAKALGRAGFFRRRWLRLRMWVAIERELGRTLKRAAPEDGLY